jgi:hypothetical protein
MGKEKGAFLWTDGQIGGMAKWEECPERRDGQIRGVDRWEVVMRGVERWVVVYERDGQM